MNRVVHFEIQVDDPKRAIAFYQTVFDWKIDQWGEQEYWMVITGEEDKTNPSKYPGINGGLLPRKGSSPTDGQAVNAYICTIQVDDIDAMIKKVESAGGTLALAKFAFPGMAWQAYYKDTEGNIFGLHQTDPNAR